MKKERYIVALFKRIAVMMALFGVPSAAVAGGVTDPACLLPFHSVVRDLAIEHHLQPTLQGRVVDGETGEPLIGASVYIQGTAIGTSTQSDGTFALTTDRLVDVLVISYVGYQTLEIQISTIDPSRQHTFRMAPAELYRNGELIVTADEVRMAYSGIYSDVKARPLEDHMSSIPGMDMVSRANFAKDPVIRGLRDGRVNVMIDGMRLTPACVDAMDPATAYIETDNLESIELQRGGQNSSSAPGGTLNFNMVKPGINSGVQGSLEAGYHSASRQQIYQAALQYGEERWAARVSGTYRDAGNFITGDGERIPLSGFRKGNLYASLLYRPHDAHELTLKYVGDFAKDIGYPALIMDTRRADAHIGGLEHHWHNPDTESLITSVNTNLYWNRVEHLMDDYDRDVASREVMQGMYMPMYGETTTFGLNSEATLAREEHLFTLSAELFGIDAFADMWMYPLSPDVNDMYLMNLGDITSRVAALSASWRHYMAAGWITGADLRVEGGLYSIRHEETFRAEYPQLNSVNPSYLDYTAGIHLERQLSSGLSAALKLSDGYRMPGHLELYGYYIYHPLDNFFYYGNPSLESERSSQAELSTLYGSEQSAFHGQLSLWVNRMDGYITGRKIDELFKRYENMGTAWLTGAELDLHVDLARGLNGGVSMAWVLGEHTELDEPLPMIPPFKGTAYLQRQSGRIQMETRIRWAAAQKRIAVRNSVETATDGYMLWDLFGSVRLMQHVRLQAGVENLLDQFYIDHLSVNSMPSPGRNLSVSLRITL